MPELKECLDLPVVGGELVAYRKSSSFEGLSREGGIGSFGWEIVIRATGPDLRYSPGQAVLNDRGVRDWIDALTRALPRLELLEGHGLTADYRESIAEHICHGLGVEIRAGRDGVWLDLWISGKSYRYARSLSRPQVEGALCVLAGVERKGTALVEALQALS